LQFAVVVSTAGIATPSWIALCTAGPPWRLVSLVSSCVAAGTIGKLESPTIALLIIHVQYIVLHINILIQMIPT
jgi:hypothetical protein